MNNKAFVAGATGYTGRQVVCTLRESGIPTVAHIRPDSPQLTKHKEFFEGIGSTVDTTPWNPHALAQTLTTYSPSLVFGLLGTTRKRARAALKAGLDPNEQSYEHVDFGYTAMLIDAANKLPIPPRFTYLSSLGVHSNAKGAYLQARWKAEEHLIKSGLPYIIARPSFITGEDREENRPLERLGALVVDSALSLTHLIGAGSLKQRYGSTTGAKLAASLVRLSLEPQAANRVFESQALH